ncbi:MAG TPA: hypothetical protein VGM91_02295 [Conexibacter sp.]
MLIAARAALLDALDALVEQRDALVLIGAQAIYLHTGAAVVALAEATKDSDLAVDDHERMTITALDPDDRRSVEIAVAGPAALLVSKLHKLAERKDDPGRLIDKDAHDIYRLLVATYATEPGTRLAELSTDSLAGPATTAATEHLRDLFSDPGALGPVMAGRAEQLVGDPDVVAAAAAALAGDLITTLDPNRFNG